MLEGLSATTIALIINVLGLPGLIFVVWYVDQKRLDKVQAQAKEDMAKVVRMYEDNVALVRSWEATSQRQEKMITEMLGVISLNTQAQTRLVESIRHNEYCPTVRKEGPNR